MKEGVKNDMGKAPIVQGLFRYFPRALRYVAFVSQYGLEKYNLEYADRNWSKVKNGFTRYTDALGRHLIDESEGEFVDPESNLFHAGHAAWNALARLELLIQATGDEDVQDNNGNDNKD